MCDARIERLMTSRTESRREFPEFRILHAMTERNESREDDVTTTENSPLQLWDDMLQEYELARVRSGKRENRTHFDIG